MKTEREKNLRGHVITNSNKGYARRPRLNKRNEVMGIMNGGCVEKSGD